MFEDNYYSKNAWQGERPLDYLIIDDPDSVFDNINVPSSVQKTLNMLRIIFMWLLVCFIFLSFAFGVIANAFGNRLYWHKMIADTFGFNSLILFSIALFTLIICFNFQCKYWTKFAEYKDYSIKASQRFSKPSFFFLKHDNFFYTLPSRILGLMDLVPSVWKKRGFKDKDEMENFSWNEEIWASYHNQHIFASPVIQKIKLINVLNWVFIITGWPFLIMQMINDDVYLPAYIIILSMSTLLLLISLMTKRKGFKKTTLVIFNRRTGMVSASGSKEKPWSCHFRELNAYYNNAARSNEYLILVPRTPIGEPRLGIDLRSWTSSTDLEACLELWNSIQHFMNIHATLPFVIPLEAVRDNDPTSKKMRPEQGEDMGELLQLRTLTDDEYRNRLKEGRGCVFSWD